MPTTTVPTKEAVREFIVGTVYAHPSLPAVNKGGINGALADLPPHDAEALRRELLVDRWLSERS